MDQEHWESLTPEQKKEELYRQQVHLLQQFRERHAISEDQYEKSLTDLTNKMGMEELFLGSI